MKSNLDGTAAKVYEALKAAMSKHSKPQACRPTFHQDFQHELMHQFQSELNFDVKQVNGSNQWEVKVGHLPPISCSVRVNVLGDDSATSRSGMRFLQHLRQTARVVKERLLQDGAKWKKQLHPENGRFQSERLAEFIKDCDLQMEEENSQPRSRGKTSNKWAPATEVCKKCHRLKDDTTVGGQHLCVVHARFQCSGCGSEWFSYQGRLRPDGVIMGQNCMKCNGTGTSEKWEIPSPLEHDNDSAGPSRGGQHRADLCQACQEFGSCTGMFYEPFVVNTALAVLKGCYVQWQAFSEGLPEILVADMGPGFNEYQVCMQPHVYVAKSERNWVTPSQAAGASTPAPRGASSSSAPAPPQGTGSARRRGLDEGEERTVFDEDGGASDASIETPPMPRASPAGSPSQRWADVHGEEDPLVFSSAAAARAPLASTAVAEQDCGILPGGENSLLRFCGQTGQARLPAAAPQLSAVRAPPPAEAPPAKAAAPAAGASASVPPPPPRPSQAQGRAAQLPTPPPPPKASSAAPAAAIPPAAAHPQPNGAGPPSAARPNVPLDAPPPPPQRVAAGPPPGPPPPPPPTEAQRHVPNGAGGFGAYSPYSPAPSVSGISVAASSAAPQSGASFLGLEPQAGSAFLAAGRGTADVDAALSSGLYAARSTEEPSPAAAAAADPSRPKAAKKGNKMGVSAASNPAPPGPRVETYLDTMCPLRRAQFLQLVGLQNGDEDTADKEALAESFLRRANGDFEIARSLAKAELPELSHPENYHPASQPQEGG